MKIQLRALIDQGSQISFINTNAANRLGLRTTPGAPSVKCVGMDKCLKTKGEATLTFSSQYNANSGYQTTVTVLDRITDQLPSEFLTIKLPKSRKSLSLADPNFFKPGPIDALLGADVVQEILEEGLLRLPNHRIIAQKSVLGWLLSGKVKLTNSIPLHLTGNVTDDEMNFEKFSQQLQSFWEIENVGPGNVLDLDDQLCEEYFLATYYRDESGRFVVRLPFKSGFRNYIRLGNSRNVAIGN